VIRYNFYYPIVISKQSIFIKNYCNSIRRCHRDNPCYRRKPNHEIRNVRQHTGICHCNLTVTTKNKIENYYSRKIMQIKKEMGIILNNKCKILRRFTYIFHAIIVLITSIRTILYYVAELCYRYAVITFAFIFMFGAFDGRIWLIVR